MHRTGLQAKETVFQSIQLLRLGNVAGEECLLVLRLDVGWGRGVAPLLRATDGGEVSVLHIVLDTLLAASCEGI